MCIYIIIYTYFFWCTWYTYTDIHIHSDLFSSNIHIYIYIHMYTMYVQTFLLKFVSQSFQFEKLRKDVDQRLQEVNKLVEARASSDRDRV